MKSTLPDSAFMLMPMLPPPQDVFHERIKTYRSWKDAENTLSRKREAKAKFEMQV